MVILTLLAPLRLAHAQLDPLPLAPELPTTDGGTPSSGITTPRLVSITHRRSYGTDQPSGLKSKLLENLNKFGAAKRHSGEVTVRTQALEPIARDESTSDLELVEPIRPLVHRTTGPIHVPTLVSVQTTPPPFTFPPPPPPPPSVIDGLMALFSTTTPSTTSTTSTTTVVSVFSKLASNGKGPPGDATTIEIAGGGGMKTGKLAPESVRQWRQRLYNVFKSVKNHHRHLHGNTGIAGSKASMKERLRKLTKQKVIDVGLGKEDL